MEFFEEINSLRWISLVNIIEANLALDIRIIGAVDLSSDVLATAYNIHFKSYTAYCVIDETYHKPSEDNASLFSISSESAYLDFILAGTTAGGFIAELKHYTFYCLNHIIHVAAFEEPVILKG